MAAGVLRRAQRRARIVRDFQWHAHWRNRPIVPGTVLYEAFSGNGMLCNPEAVFTGLRRADDLRHLRHVWVLSDLDRYRRTVQRFRGDPRVRFVRYDSMAYWRALATSQYLVNNSTFPWQFAKRPGQTYLNTWHGTPLKQMGYHVPGGGPDTRNIVRNFLHADYLLSGSEFMTRTMYEDGYKLRGIYRGAIVQEGLPRIDRQVLDPAGRARVRAQLAAGGVQVGPDERIVLYAPTWRGDSFHDPDADTARLRAFVTELTGRLAGTGWRVLVKVHQVVSAAAAADPRLAGVLVPNELPANEVLGIADALVTDYSSICYDFLATGRPVLFHLPDLAHYSDRRGLYTAPADLPGPVSDAVPQLAARLAALGTGGAADVTVSHAARYAKAVDQYCPNEDGHVTERVIDVVFRGARAGHDVRTDFSDGRRSILIYLGGLRPNGINASARNLLDTIDHDRFDVSVLYSYHGRSRQRRDSEAAINPRVRLFPRVGGLNGSKRFTLAKRQLLRQGLGGRLVDVAGVERLFADEWTRCFGAARFDHVVDFSGYSPLWAFLLLAGRAARSHTIWLHNDLATDRYKRIDGRQPLRPGLGALFSMYDRFDRLVSVSEALTAVNRAGLARYAPADKFVSARNTVDGERVLRMASDEYVAGMVAERERAARQALAGEPVPHGTFVEPSDGFAGSTPIEQLAVDVAGVTTFVTVGRLSPEKNHRRLVDAFARVHRQEPDTRLIVVGDGPLRGRLAEQITELGLDEAVLLAGHQENPFPVLAHADCFVLSSDYEGQPMVVLEARLLGLPVVCTDFDSVRSAVPAGAGLVVPRTAAGLARGMLAHLAGEVPSAPFDHVGYNRVAIGEFYRAIGATD